MKRLLALAILGMTSAPALAADLGGQGSLKDSFDTIPTPASGGMYIDFGIGGSFNKSGKDSVVYVPDLTSTTGGTFTDKKDLPSGSVGYTVTTVTTPAVDAANGAPATPAVTTTTYYSGSPSAACPANSTCQFVGAKATTAKSTYGYSGALAETRLGYDFRLGNGGWFLGPLASISYDWAADNGFENGFGYKFGGRVGYQLPGARLFVDGGYVGNHVRGTGFSEDVNGLFIGGGAEVAVTRNTYLFARADWEKYGSFTASDGFSVDNSSITALAGLGFRW